MTAKTAEDRLRYAKQYANCPPADILQFSPNKRIHVMKALSCLARYTGRAEQWRQTRQQYQLTWSTGTEKIDAFTRFFDSSKDLDTMLQWLRQALQVLSSDYANFYLFCTLTGLRASECVESVRLLNSGDTPLPYYNPEQQVLQHYRFADIFIRRTKACYIPIVNDEIVAIAKKIGQIPGYDALKRQTKHRNLNMRLKYCRKIYASWLHRCGESADLVDVLQGRISKSIFVKHYLVPDSSFKSRVLTALHQLLKQVVEQ